MRLALYLISSFLVAILCMAFVARGPDEMIVNALIIWFMPAFLAFAVRNKDSVAGRYALPAIAQAIVTFFMLNGMSTI